jgi:hypothetical protein
VVKLPSLCWCSSLLVLLPLAVDFGCILVLLPCAVDFSGLACGATNGDGLVVGSPLVPGAALSLLPCHGAAGLVLLP